MLEIDEVAGFIIDKFLTVYGKTFVTFIMSMFKFDCFFD